MVVHGTPGLVCIVPFGRFFGPVTSYLFRERLRPIKAKKKQTDETITQGICTHQGVNLRRKFAFARTPSFSPKVITWLEPAIKAKN